MSSLPASRSDIRRELRGRRRALSVQQQRVAARQLAHRLRQLPALASARHVALYWPNDGEIDPRLLARIKPAKQQLYLPVLQAFPAHTLRFVRWSPRMRLRRNRFGIPEPHGARRPAQSLDVMLMPLVGFDAAGNRLGMGGGFYDRTLARRQGVAPHKPLLIGIAHACQQVAQLGVAAWDIPLHLVVTDQGIIHTRSRCRSSY